MTTNSFRRPIEVIKVGGSLFDLPELPLHLATLRALRDKTLLFVFGGGARVEALRAAHGRGEMTADEAHWRAIATMGEAAREWGERLDWAMARSWEEIEAFHAERTVSVIVDVDPLLRGSAKELPVGWEVTSDSIAAWLTKRVHGDKLLLLKSVAAKREETLDDWQRRGLVDDYFPVIGGELLRAGAGISVMDLRRE